MRFQDEKWEYKIDVKDKEHMANLNKKLKFIKDYVDFKEIAETNNVKDEMVIVKLYKIYCNSQKNKEKIISKK